ncbi:hypothetical protein CASFOL_034624 [Castilleja foliolosa]|uniref:Uncharacterized protein n=1 Tax=Castilleja foliolosa TaxID=1961234 RepID=A0ABD3BSK9_9LAMI
MKGRDNKGPPSTDLLVCFPTRAHLTLMPKPICSPARPSEPSTSHHHPRQRRLHHPSHHHHLRKSSTHGSPLSWAKANKPNNSDTSEPTSPKVTCAGQIKVRPKPKSCKNWQSVMEEIERLHNKSKQKKRSAWADALGFKKDALQFLTCLRNIRFDFRCFGSFPTAEISSDDDEDEHDDEVENKGEINDQSSRAVFSKWFMILPENQDKGKMIRPCLDEDEEEEGGDNLSVGPPPANALMLMRCRSAPAKSWLEEKLEEEEEEEEKEREIEKEREKEGKQRLLVMNCGDEFSKLSADIAKETWVVGGIKDMLSRSLSSKR